MGESRDATRQTREAAVLERQWHRGGVTRTWGEGEACMGRVCPRCAIESANLKWPAAWENAFWKSIVFGFTVLGGCEHIHVKVSLYCNLLVVMSLVPSENVCSMTFNCRPTATASALIR